MRLTVKILVLVCGLFVFAGKSMAQSSNYKCMIQMISYEGEKAYVVVSLINPKGEYEKTLSVLGPDKQWFNTLKEWYKFLSKTDEKISAVTGASIGGGDRAMRTLEIEDSKLDKGYKLRFESAVEEQKYYTTDVEVPLNAATISGSFNGTGYVKLVKLIKVQ